MSQYPKTLFFGNDEITVHSFEEENLFLEKILGFLQDNMGLRVFNRDGIEQPLSLQIGDVTFVENKRLRDSVKSTILAG